MITTNSIDCSIEELYNTIEPLEIFHRYIVNFKKIGVLFNSELREDPRASCEIKYSRNNQLYYKDYGEEGFLTPIQYVMKKYSLNSTQAKRFILADFNKKITDIKLSPTINYNYTKKLTILKKKKREWLDEDLAYWGEYGWTRAMLEQANIEPISAYWLNGEKYTCYDPAYCYNYYWNNGTFRRKLYFPKRENYRFLSNIDETIVQGWNLLSKKGGDVLFITSSFKDIGVFWRINEVCNAIAPNTETSFIPIKPLEKLKKRWGKIIIWFDNDTQGIKSAKKFSKEYSIDYDHTPIGDPKDPSDYVEKYGLDNFKKLILKYYENTT